MARAEAGITMKFKRGTFAAGIGLSSLDYDAVGRAFTLGVRYDLE